MYKCLIFERPLIPTHTELGPLTVLSGPDCSLFTFISVTSFVQMEGSISLHKRKMWIETLKKTKQNTDPFDGFDFKKKMEQLLWRY